MYASMICVCIGAFFSCDDHRMCSHQVIVLHGDTNAAAHYMGWTCIAGYAFVIMVFQVLQFQPGVN